MSVSDKAPQHAESSGPDLEMSDYVVLGHLIVESLEQNLITIAGIDAIGNLPQQLQRRVGEILEQEWVEAGTVDHVRQRAKSGFFFETFAAVTDVEQAFKIAERDG